MDPDKTKEFNKRLSQWVASQGFWFQVRYSMVSSGASGRVMFHLFQMMFRVVLFLLILGVVLWMGLVKHKQSKGFAESLLNRVQSGFTASHVELRGVQNTRGQLEIASMVAEGDNGTFFKSVEASSIRCDMGLLDGLVGVWRPGVISIASLEMDLIPGADDAHAASKLADVVFGRSEKVEVTAFEVAKSNISWGFTSRTQGAIRNSWMRAQRTADGWRVIFKGGEFSQNWFRGLRIEKLVLLCDRDGIVFESAEFSQEGGVVDFSGLRLIAGPRPTLDGRMTVKNLNLNRMLPKVAVDFMEGRISGEFEVFGSPNGASGIGYEGGVVLGEDDQIVLRDKIHILKALSVMDYSRNYHRVDLNNGSFNIKTTNGGMELSDVDLNDDNSIFSLQGEMKIRLPTQREIRAAIAKEEADKGSGLFKPKPEKKPEPEVVAADAPEKLTLGLPTQGGELVEPVKDEGEGGNPYDHLSMVEEMRMLELEASSQMSRMLKCEGLFRITIPVDAFERAPELEKMYPVDQDNSGILMEVPIDGDLSDITLKLAQEIYKHGRR